MLQRVTLWAVGRYFGGPGRSWLFIVTGTLLLRGLKRITGRRPRVEVIKLGKKHQLAIDHLPVTHRRQLAETRRARRRNRRAGRGKESPGEDGMLEG